MKQIDRILRKMNEMGWVPKPFLSDLEWDVANALVNKSHLGRNIPEITVPLGSITLTQARHDQGKIDGLVADGVCDGGLAFKRNGEIFLYDGHHRHYAAEQLGRKQRTIKCLDLGDGVGKDGLTLKELADKLGVRVKSVLQAMDSDARRNHEERH